MKLNNVQQTQQNNITCTAEIEIKWQQRQFSAKKQRQLNLTATDTGKSERKQTAIHCKKGLAVFHPQPGCHLPNYPWAGRIQFSPAREHLVSDIPVGDGKTDNLFLQCRAARI
jgi:hypothetical protein